jgi:hypothetical protein
MTEDTPSPTRSFNRSFAISIFPRARSYRPITDKVIMTALHVHQNTSSGSYLGPAGTPASPVPSTGILVDGTTVYVLNELSRDLVVMPISTGPNDPPSGRADPDQGRRSPDRDRLLARFLERLRPEPSLAGCVGG